MLLLRNSRNLIYNISIFSYYFERLKTFFEVLITSLRKTSFITSIIKIVKAYINQIIFSLFKIVGYLFQI